MAFDVYAYSGIDFVVDLTGYFSAAPSDANGAGLAYYPLTAPIRLLDTRPGQPACLAPGAPLLVGAPATVDARRPCRGNPAGAGAIAGNGTVVNGGTTAGYVTLWPSATPRPVVSNLNYGGGQIVANAFTVGLGGDGAFALYAYSTVDFVVDVVGCYAP